MAATKRVAFLWHYADWLSQPSSCRLAKVTSHRIRKDWSLKCVRDADDPGDPLSQGLELVIEADFGSSGTPSAGLVFAYSILKLLMPLLGRSHS